MASLFRPTYKDSTGNRRQSAVWWMKFYIGGKAVRENTKKTDCQEAMDILKHRVAEATLQPLTVCSSRRVLFKELAELVKTNYEINNRRSMVDIELRFRLHILPVFGERKACDIGAADIDQYILKRKREGAKNSTINRDLQTIKRAYRLGIKKRLIYDRPAIDLLDEDNVRQGFFEPAEYEAIRRHLDDDCQPVIDFAYITGWRKSEVLNLEWPQVDSKAGFVRLEPGTTKNRRARQFPITAELRAVLDRQKAKADQLKREGIICPLVFNRDGEPIEGFKRQWKSACRRAGYPGRLIHDFRRTAVRNLVRAGISEGIAMKLTGHVTRSVFERYNITSEPDLREAGRRLEAFHGQSLGKVTADFDGGKAVND